VALHKGGLTDATVTNENEFVLSEDLLLSFHLWSKVRD
jgi:hypothetical protein